MSRVSRTWLVRGIWTVVGIAAVIGWIQFRFAVRLIPASSAVAASALALRDLDGNPVSLDDYRGQVVLVNLWASWCGPCKVEIPGLTRIDEALRDQGLTVLGVSIDRLSADRIAAVAAELGIRYQVAVPAAPLQGTFGGTEVVPYTWILDRSGRIRAAHAGLATAGSLRRACERLLNEP